MQTRRQRRSTGEKKGLVLVWEGRCDGTVGLSSSMIPHVSREGRAQVLSDGVIRNAGTLLHEREGAPEKPLGGYSTLS